MVVSSIPVQHSNLRAMMLHRSRPVKLQTDVTTTTLTSKPIINSTAPSLMSIMLTPNYSDARLIQRLNVLLLRFKKQKFTQYKEQSKYRDLITTLFEQNQYSLAPKYCQQLLENFKKHKQAWPKRSSPYKLLETLIFQLNALKDLNTKNCLITLNNQLNGLNALLKL